MRIGIIAPPWIALPPESYGGTESVVDRLAHGLVQRGHHVDMFTVGGSRNPAHTRWYFEEPAQPIGDVTPEALHVLAAYQAMADVELIHDHTVLGPLLAPLLARRDIPVVTTNHGPVTTDIIPLWVQVTRHAALVAISHAQHAKVPGIPVEAVIHHGVDLRAYTYGPGGDHLMFIGRMAEEKGPDRAITIARQAGRPIVLATKMWEPPEREYFERKVEPLLGDDVELKLDTTMGERVELLQRADALINPIRWDEPFGLVMAEALACGTPVLSFGSGSAPEIVDHGVTGFLESTEDALAADVARIDELDRNACRQAAEERFSVDRMVADHEALYTRLVADHPGPA
jgi:glycosyltransferase involved in cell wall biosynthesis